MLEQRHKPANLWVEVVDPLADAMNLLAGAIQATSGELTGVSIALTDVGTLVLNQRAWLMYGEALKTLYGLKTRHVTRDETKPVRSLLIAADEVATEYEHGDLLTYR